MPRRLMHSQQSTPGGNQPAQLGARDLLLRRGQPLHRVQVAANAFSQDLEQNLVHTSDPLACVQPWRESTSTHRQFRTGVRRAQSLTIGTLPMSIRRTVPEVPQSMVAVE